MEIGCFDFQGLWKGRKTALSFSGLSIDRHFLRPLSFYAVSRNRSNSLFLASCVRRAASVSLSAAAMRFRALMLSPRAQVLCWIIQLEQGFQRSLVALVADAFAASEIDLDVGLGAGAMIVQIWVEVLAIEVVEAVGVARIDVSVADMFADHRAVFGLHQAVVAALPRTAFGLFDEQFFKQLGDGTVDELRAVVGSGSRECERGIGAACSPARASDKPLKCAALQPTTCHCVTSSTALI